MKKIFLLITILITYSLNIIFAQSWTQLGSEIDGEAAGDQSGNSVSLSSDGRMVAIGAWGNNDAGNNA